MRAMKASGVEWLGDIPEQWKLGRLKHSLRASVRSSGLVKGQALLEAEDGAFVGYSASGQDIFIPRSSSKPVKVPGLVLSSVGARCGRTFLATAAEWGLVANTEAWTISPEFSPRFVWFYSQLPHVWIRGGSAQPYVQTPASLMSPMPKPPISEQERIADFLERETAKIDALIAKQEQLITTLDERRGAVISRAVTRGLVEDRPFRKSGVEWLGEIPADWEVSRIGACVTERRDTVSDADFPALSVTKKGVVPQIDSAAKSDNTEGRKLIRKDDFVINSRSDRKGSSGVSNFDGGCSVVYIVLKLKRFLPAYAHHLFRSQPFQEEFYRWGTGIVDDLWSTRYSSMKQIPVPVPGLDEQRRIADFLERDTARFDQLRAEATRMIRLLGERRQALISAAVTGKLEVGV